ncbi:MAG: hypothetical protein ACFFBE_15495, partial [Promethearchaeota archaeon]
KRYNYNIKLAQLKKEKIRFERQWRYLNKKIANFQKPELNENSLVLIDYTRKALVDIENKLNIMNQKLEEQILDINEEDTIIEELRKLETEKQKNIKNLAELERKQLQMLQSSEYYNTKKEIQKLEDSLTDIYEDLLKYSYKRLMTHKKILDLYKQTTEFEKIKRKIENELIESKTTAENFHQLFLKLMDVNKRVLLDELPNKIKPRIRPKEIKTPNVKAIIKKKKKYKRFEQKKLQIALEKQKSGKKLDFYEYKLILKHSKK